MGGTDLAKTREDGKRYQVIVRAKVQNIKHKINFFFKLQRKAEYNPFKELQVVPDRVLGDIWE